MGRGASTEIGFDYFNFHMYLMEYEVITFVDPSPTCTRESLKRRLFNISLSRGSARLTPSADQIGPSLGD